jgi:hypothetical protein
MTECWNGGPGTASRGWFRRGYVGVKVKGKEKFMHREVFAAIYGYYPEVVMHKCDNPLCYNPAHLFPGTHADNVRDKVEKNRQAKGEQNGRSKLTYEQVDEIRKRLVLGEKGIQAQLAKEYKVDPKVISRIKYGKAWK